MTNTEIPQVVEVNCTTGELVYRPMNEQELAQREIDNNAWEAEQVAILAEKERVAALKTSARNKLVAGEPLTAEEASVLVI